MARSGMQPSRHSKLGLFEQSAVTKKLFCNPRRPADCIFPTAYYAFLIKTRAASKC